MLMTPPPGYDTTAVNQQYNSLLGRPVPSNAPNGARVGSMAPGMPALSSNPLAGGSAAQRMQALVKLLQGGGK